MAAVRTTAAQGQLTARWAPLRGCLSRLSYPATSLLPQMFHREKPQRDRAYGGMAVTGVRAAKCGTPRFGVLRCAPCAA